MSRAVIKIPFPWHCWHILILIFHKMHTNIFGNEKHYAITAANTRQPVSHNIFHRIQIPRSVIAQNAPPEYRRCTTRIPWYHQNVLCIHIILFAPTACYYASLKQLVKTHLRWTSSAFKLLVNICKKWYRFVGGSTQQCYVWYMNAIRCQYDMSWYNMQIYKKYIINYYSITTISNKNPIKTQKTKTVTKNK